MNTTTHRFRTADSAGAGLTDVHHASLVVTSPPYPMVSMWDDVFAGQSAAAKKALENDDGLGAFEAMHLLLDRVWARCFDALLAGGLVCINIGDAVRKTGSAFRLYTNAARVTRSLEQLGFTILPGIIWRKPANSPTKFMGSGVLPGGAYMTLEHEHIIIARKGDLRRPAGEHERWCRRRSAIFWEERNEWYSDLWSLQGIRQSLETHNGHRSRSAAYPLELAYRLIAMHSWQGDLVVDPFSGTGTTAAAAVALARSSLSVDHDAALNTRATRWLLDRQTLEALNHRNETRVSRHREFVAGREKPPKHFNASYGPVVTGQETDLRIPRITDLRTGPDNETIECSYEVSVERNRD